VPIVFNIVTEPPRTYVSESDLTDLTIAQGPLDSSKFPGAPSGVLVHEGFRDEHAKTADTILPEVQKLLSEKNTTNVVTVSVADPQLNYMSV
jgi:hypothetical protein